MAVVIVAEVHGQTEAGYDGMLKVLEGRMRQAEGFVLHSAYRVESHWRVVEVWRSRVDADRFFANHVAPNLPPGVRSKRSVYETHSLLTADSGDCV